MESRKSTGTRSPVFLLEDKDLPNLYLSIESEQRFVTGVTVRGIAGLVDPSSTVVAPRSVVLATKDSFTEECDRLLEQLNRF